MGAAENPSAAEIVVLNTCTVTSSADQDARAAIRRIRRQNPDCKIVVTGCYAQRAPIEIAALPGVTRVVGNSHKHELAELTLGEDNSGHSEITSDNSGFVPLSGLLVPGRFSALAAVNVSDIFAHTELMAAPVFDSTNERTRPNLKIQDGCDNRCSFCVIPYVRGQSRSMSMDDVIFQVSGLVDSGYREVVISGINLGRWGRDLETPVKFKDLIKALLDRTSLEKLRISSVEPMDWTDELIALVAQSSRIAKHAHVPMQSGSDRILRKMHRKYRPWHYAKKINTIRAAMPDAAIGADVMVGFPGETDEDFESTRRMVEQLPFTYLHVFTYSPRPGTPAAEMRDQVPVRLARDRNQILRDLIAEKKRAFMESLIGKTVHAITLNVPHESSTDALTDNFLRLQVKGSHKPNCWIQTLVHAIEGEVLLGHHAN